jgi:hypothetical protein
VNDPQRSKAAAMFGKTFMDAAKPTPPAKNYATAQQKVANSRPIPTYKVGGPVKKAMGGDARMFDEAVAAMPSPVMRAVGGAGKTRKGQAPIKRAMGGPVKDGSKKDAEYGDYVAGEKDRKSSKPVKKADGGGSRKGGLYVPGPPFRNDAERAKHMSVSEAHSRDIMGSGSSVKPKRALLEKRLTGKKIKEYLENEPVKKAMGGVGKMRHDVPMKGVKPHKGIGV